MRRHVGLDAWSEGGINGADRRHLQRQSRDQGAGRNLGDCARQPRRESKSGWSSTAKPWVRSRRWPAISSPRLRPNSNKADGAGPAHINRGAPLDVCAVSWSSFARERKCGALIRAGYGALPCSRACARETESDQGQAVETPRFEVQKTGDYRAAKSDRQRLPASAALRANDASI